MSKAVWDVAVIGGGVIGLSLARELRQAGIERVVVLERHGAVGPESSSRANGGFRAQFTTAANIAFSLFSIGDYFIFRRQKNRRSRRFEMALAHKTTHSHNDTILAGITPPGEGGIAALRLAGPDSLTYLARFFRPTHSENAAPTPFLLR